MSFVIWYQVKIREAAPAGGLLAGAASLLGLGLPVSVSNDPFSGSYILDADITVTMSAGAAADDFEVKLNNLPADVADMLKSKRTEGLAAGEPLEAEIHLGYFDQPSTTLGAQPVMVGAITSIRSTVSSDGTLVTVLKGQELGGYQLRTTCVAEGRQGATSAEEFVKALAGRAKVELRPGSGLTKPLKDFTLVGDNALDALRQIAELAEAPLVIRDKTILMGKLVGAEAAPEPLDPDANIVKLDQVEESEEVVEPCAKRTNGRRTSAPRSRLDLTVLGNPRLRVGQNVVVKTADAPTGTLRIEKLVHRFSTTGGESAAGYTCEVTAVVAEPGKPARPVGGARGIVDRFRDLSEGALDRRPAIDVGQVTDYAPGNKQKHLATLRYGQSPPVDAVAPSVEVEVDADPTINNKPMASPFAFHKSGLIVPVYPGMRALLAHNRGLVNDAVVAGFLWPENPRYEPPKNEPGDYWLCLPTELGSDGRPTGKGVNDLIDKSGLRIIQVKGLHILVGADKLSDVGARPAVPAENTVVIEHQSGSKITIDSGGKVIIETKNKDVSLTNGSVTLKLTGAAVEVS
jgi:hypothetical protein